MIFKKVSYMIINEVYLSGYAEKDLKVLSTDSKNALYSLISEMIAGKPIGKKKFKKLSSSNYYELRFKCTDGIYRAIGAFELEGFIVYTIFKKKSNKTPLQELELVRRRQSNYLNLS